MAYNCNTRTQLLPIERSSAIAPRKPKCCVPARFILLWNFAVVSVFKALYDVSIYMQFNRVLELVSEYIAAIILISICSTFAGVLTDIKFSRYRTVLCSSYFIIISTLLLVVNSGAFTISIKMEFSTNSLLLPLKAINVALFVISLIPVMIFLVNGIQFGMDQLHDSSTEDSILFIHWYVWIYYIAGSCSHIGWNFVYDTFISTAPINSKGIFGTSFVIAECAMVWLLIAASIYVTQCKKMHFHIEPPGVNPYALVFRVVRFACRHKVPLRRSAFTYCEDELPSRMDLGKSKYGGPFTTKEVEDVKAFLGVLKVLCCIGPALMLQTAMHSTLSAFSKHSNLYRLYDNSTNFSFYVNSEGEARHLLISNGLMEPLLVVICIPLYLCLFRPHISYYIPGMLKRIGLGICLTILSLAASLAMDVAVHETKTRDAQCMFSGLTKFTEGNTVHNTSDINSTSLPLFQNIYFFMIQHFLSAVTNMLIDVAVLEFTCSQSPYSMKGLLLGFFFSLKAAIQAVTVGSIFPFGLAWKLHSLSCGSGYYAILVAVGMLELILFSFIAKRYKYRTISEPSNEYRYAEEYYSNIP